MKLEYLKIKYVFIEGRNPDKDIKNAMRTIAEDVFIGSFYEYILPEIIKKTPKNHTRQEMEEAIDYFIANLEDHIKDESIMMRRLIMYPENLKKLKQKIKQVME